jgi:hypothetical protein
MTPLERTQTSAAKTLDKKNRLELMSGILGMRHIEDEQRSHRKNREAEEQHVRKHVWGYDDSESAEESEDVGHTIVGDIQQTPPVVVTNSNPSAILVGALLAASAIGVPAAALIGYSLAKEDPPPQRQSAEFDDTASQLKLGRIEDYIREDR